jgi:predicted HD phosphohydrolase
MTTKHTPGPWSTWEFDARSIAVGPDAGGLAVAEIVSTNAHGITTAQTEERGAANARLIAAAPDLLHALRLMLREHDALQMAEGSTDDRWAAATLARAVLNKLGD